MIHGIRELTEEDKPSIAKCLGLPNPFRWLLSCLSAMGTERLSVIRTQETRTKEIPRLPNVVPRGRGHYLGLSALGTVSC